MDDLNEAIRLDPDNAYALDLPRPPCITRRVTTPTAMADYDKLIKINPRDTNSIDQPSPVLFSLEKA